jgi:hypothetical protein
MNTQTLCVAGALLVLVHAGCGDDDNGSCQESGQRCGGTAGKCCSGLMCCSGVPVPQGQEYCAKDCPISDRNAKTNIRAVSDPDAVLRRVCSLPISTWSYKNEPSKVRHIGPMAQDFKAAFKVGSSDRHISPVDADGVALAAIQALEGRLRKMQRELDALRAELRSANAGCKTSR